eukprot:8121715-Pyramimonas_sp.AAC.1
MDKDARQLPRLTQPNMPPTQSVVLAPMPANPKWPVAVGELPPTAIPAMSPRRRAGSVVPSARAIGPAA